MATYNKAADLINIGAYVDGSNPAIDQAIALMPDILKFLRQKANVPTAYTDILTTLKSIADAQRQIAAERING